MVNLKPHAKDIDYIPIIDNLCKNINDKQEYGILMKNIKSHEDNAIKINKLCQFTADKDYFDFLSREEFKSVTDKYRKDSKCVNIIESLKKEINSENTNNENIKNLIKKIDEYESKYDTKNKLEIYKKSKEDMQKNIEKIKSEFEKNEMELEKYKKILNELQNKKTACKSKLNELQNKKTTCEKESSELQNKKKTACEDIKCPEPNDEIKDDNNDKNKDNDDDEYNKNTGPTYEKSVNIGLPDKKNINLYKFHCEQSNDNKYYLIYREYDNNNKVYCYKNASKNDRCYTAKDRSTCNNIMKHQNIIRNASILEASEIAKLKELKITDDMQKNNNKKNKIKA
jgi:hypothetical protein